MSHSNFILTQAQCDVLAKSFHKYDTEENGKIDVLSALQLCAEVLGHEVSVLTILISDYSRLSLIRTRITKYWLRSTRFDSLGSVFF